MRYLPHTSTEIKEMLELIGVRSMAELFASIPETLTLKAPLPLPAPLSEMGLRDHLRSLSRENAHGDEWLSFLGAGAYRHYIPSAVGALIARSEFATSYTPYQPEVSQGTLQALFEYQTMVAEIFGMEVANASNYDGASAAAEAVLMALRINKRKKILLARSLHPEYREVIRTYLKYLDVTIHEIPFDPKSGALNHAMLKAHLDSDLSALVVGYPNFFGIIEELHPLTQAVHEAGGLVITATPEPWALALVKSPGECDVDIAVGEGQSFGNAIAFGGPSLGLFATREAFVRQLPGRLVGETVDHQGQRGYVLTLATREQHIRRERATSNICTNVSLCALAATITLSLIGKAGFAEIARCNLARTHAAAKMFSGLPGVELTFSGAFFNEFVLKLPRDPMRVLAALREEKIFGGVALAPWYPELENALLICVTEMNQPNETQTYRDRFKKLLVH